MKPPAPTASGSVTEHADWLEMAALKSPDRSISMEALVGVVRRGGSVDGIADGDHTDRGSEISQQIADDAFLEIENRKAACNGSYPFSVSGRALSVRDGAENSMYTLMLLLSSVAPTSGHTGTAVLFERICTHAAREYFGGATSGVEAWRFGSPRKSPHVTLNQAIDHICKELAEGGGCADRKKGKRNKGDGGLDIVAWKAFPDKKVGKLIAFGQCAGGKTDWEVKASELDGVKFAKKWFREPFAVDPLRVFFIPRWVDSGDWRDIGIDAGIVFDRGRIAAYANQVDTALITDCNRVSIGLLKELRNQ